jgi:hypothetical protein
MKQGSVKKPAGWLAMVGLAAAGALALFAFSSGDSAYAASADDSQMLQPQVFNQEAPPGRRGDDDDCDRDWDRNGGRGDDDCCDRDGWDRDGRGGRDDDDCDRDDHDRDDCDRDRDRDRWDRDSRDRDRDRDDCDRHDDHDDDDCDDDDHDRDRHRDHDDDDCDESTITIIKDASPSSNDTFSFGGDLGSFTLRDGQSRNFRVDSGTYTVWENVKGDWDLESVDCSGDGIVTKQNDGVRIRVSDDDHVTCIFNNEGAAPVKVVSPAVAPQPQIIYVPVPAPQPVARPVEVVREPAPAPRPAAPVASLPRTGQGPDFQQEGNLALPLGALAALSLAGFGYLAVRRVRDTE